MGRKKGGKKKSTWYPGETMIECRGSRPNAKKFKGPDEKLYHNDKRGKGDNFWCATRSTARCDGIAFYNDDNILAITEHSSNCIQNQQQSTNDIQNKGLKEDLEKAAKSSDNRPASVIVKDLKEKWVYIHFSYW